MDTSSLDDLKIIDCDTHMTEPPDLWTSRVPASLRDRVPVQKTIDGVTTWYVEGESWAGTGGNTVGRHQQKVLGLNTIQPFEALDPSAWDCKARLAMMDDAGIYAEIIYPNAVGFSSNHIFAIKDLELRQLVLQTYNDYFVDLQDQSGGRLLPQALLPIWDMDLTVAEMTRLLDRDIRGFTLTDKPENLGLPELPEAYYAPMWDLFNESGAVANFHIGSGNRRVSKEEAADEHSNPSIAGTATPELRAAASLGLAWNWFGRQRSMVIIGTQVMMSNMRIIANLCMSDMFDRYPNLKISSAESGVGWIPFMLESLEFIFDRMVVDPTERALAKRRPTEYFHDHIYVTFWFETVAAKKMFEDIGPANILVETDFPHSGCLFPGARERFAEVMDEVSPDIRRLVLQDNAARIYKIAFAS